MKIFLLLIPLITVIFGNLIYKFQNRKKEILKLDLVQFTYLFLIAPAMFIWMKSFIFYILRNELDLNLSITDLFIVDTIFSVLSFVVISAIAIHTLTKTFWIKRYHDPEFDIYHLSEYFHLWWSHIVMWGGGMVICTFISIVNVLVPIHLTSTFLDPQFYLVLFSGIFFGISMFMFVWNSDPKQGNYMRLMKLLFAFFLLIHIFIYFIFDPSFDITSGVYWFMLVAFASSVFASATFEKSKRTNKFRNFLLHNGWGENQVVDIFSSFKKYK